MACPTDSRASEATPATVTVATVPWVPSAPTLTFSRTPCAVTGARASVNTFCVAGGQIAYRQSVHFVHLSGEGSKIVSMQQINYFLVSLA